MKYKSTLFLYVTNLSVTDDVDGGDSLTLNGESNTAGGTYIEESDEEPSLAEDETYHDAEEAASVEMSASDSEGVMMPSHTTSQSLNTSMQVSQ